jgi:putative SOS response-associated peptidase YedK
VCGRFTQQRPTSELAEIFEAEDLADDPGGRYNVAPTDGAAVVVQRDGRRAVVRYGWGLVPGWAADARGAARAFNARAETVATSPLFRDPFRRRRCLVPVDGFYEWRRTGSTRQPMWIHDQGGGVLVLAGLWTGRREPETGEWRRTFTIVTTGPNSFMREIHDRMPVVLPRDAWTAWLAVPGATVGAADASGPGVGSDVAGGSRPPTHAIGAERTDAELRALLEPRDDIPLSARPVPTLVNNVRNDGPALIEPLAGPSDTPTLL